MAESRRTRRPGVGHAEPHCGGGGWHPRPAGERALPLHSESVGASRVESRETAGVEYPEGLALCFLTVWVLTARPRTSGLDGCRHLATALVDSARNPIPSSSL